MPKPCRTVEAVGPNCKRDFQKGDRVIVYHICGCGDFMLAEEYTLLDLRRELSFVDGAIISRRFGTSFQGVRRADVSGKEAFELADAGEAGKVVFVRY